MTRLELRTLLSQNQIDVIDISPGGQLLTVRDPASQRCHRIDMTKLEPYTEEEIRGVLTGKREPEGLDVYQRIIGYYSNERNWNRSKLGEMEARRAGPYDLPGTFLADPELRKPSQPYVLQDHLGVSG